MSLFKETKKLVKSVIEVNDAKDPTVEIEKANYELEISKQKAEQVIRICTAQLKRFEKERQSFGGKFETSDLEKQEILKIKQAYYTLYVIKMTKIKMTSIHTTNMLYDAKADLTKALHLVNGVKYRTHKPGNLQYLIENKLLYGDLKNIRSGNLQNVSKLDKVAVESLYNTGELVDGFVSDDLIEKLKKGQPASMLMSHYEGISVPFNEAIKCDPDFGGDTDFNILSQDLDDLLSSN